MKGRSFFRRKMAQKNLCAEGRGIVQYLNQPYFALSSLSSASSWFSISRYLSLL